MFSDNNGIVPLLYIHMTLDTYTDVFQAMDNDAISKYDEHLNSM